MPTDIKAPVESLQSELAYHEAMDFHLGGKINDLWEQRRVHILKAEGIKKALEILNGK